jgi:hypothetical protein
MPVSIPVLKAPMVSALGTRISWTAFTLCFQIQPAPLHPGGPGAPSASGAPRCCFCRSRRGSWGGTSWGTRAPRSRARPWRRWCTLTSAGLGELCVTRHASTFNHGGQGDAWCLPCTRGGVSVSLLGDRAKARCLLVQAEKSLLHPSYPHFKPTFRESSVILDRVGPSTAAPPRPAPRARAPRARLSRSPPRTFSSCSRPRCRPLRRSGSSAAAPPSRPVGLDSGR